MAGGSGLGAHRSHRLGGPGPDRGGLLSGLAGQSADLGLLRQGLPWLRPLTRSWTNLDLAWSQLLHYDHSSQDALMQRWLGPFRSWQGMVLVVGMAFALTLAVGILGLLRATPAKTSSGASSIAASTAWHASTWCPNQEKPCRPSANGQRTSFRS